MSRVEEIREQAQAELAAFTAWLNETSDEEGGDDPAPDGRYWEPLEAWLRCYSPQALPIAQREMKDLDHEYQVFNDSMSAMPHQAFWTARDAAQKATMKQPPQLKPRKTPAQLVAEDVPLRQIAYEWRLLIPRKGDSPLPDMAAVQRELDAPGSVLTPEYIEADNQWRLAQMGFVALGPPASDSDWNPESVDDEQPLMPQMLEMIEQRANIGQIANLLNLWRPNTVEVWEAAVRATATAMRVHLPNNATETVREGAADYVGPAGAQLVGARPVMEESHVELSAAPVEAQPSDQDKEIMRRFESGEDVGAIAAALAIEPKKVKRAINKWQGKLSDGQ